MGQSDPRPDVSGAATPERADSLANEALLACRETHLSFVVLEGERVYKARKAVDLGFVDFREVAAREEDCRREVDRNRRYAPDVYLGVGHLLAPDGTREPVVVMRRLPASRSLSALVSSGSLSEREIDSVARAVAAVHAGAPRSAEISAAGSPEAVAAVLEDLFRRAERWLGDVLDPRSDEQIRSAARRFLAGRRSLLEARIGRGAVCEGHGDLQAGDVYVLDDGPRILDCIQFDDRLRWLDTVADVAFLMMDLERLGAPEAAEMLWRRYCEFAGDHAARSLLDFWIAQRAYVRAVVTAERSVSGPLTDDDARLARELHTLAAAHLDQARVRLVLVGGLPGSGKSTLSDALAGVHGWLVLRTDEIRRESELADRYGPEATRDVYSSMLERAETSLALGESVVLDATWWSGAERERARLAAAATFSDVVEIVCECDDAEAERRIIERLRGNVAVELPAPDSAVEPAAPAGAVGLSEATPEVRRNLAASFDNWPEAVVVDTSGPSERSLAAAEAALGFVAATVRS